METIKLSVVPANMMKKIKFKVNYFESMKRVSSRKVVIVAGLALSVAAIQPAQASENTPRRPFAQWAEVPAEGQLVFGLLYEQSEAYYIWAGSQRHNVTVHSDSESYGIDNRQGYLTFDYGLTERWAADLNIGATTVGWRAFNPDGSVGEATGAMDTTLGVRYQIFKEGKENASWLPDWLPTSTFRAAGILPGSYDRHVAFAPGNHSAAIEPSLLLRKNLFWTGFGAYSDTFYRWEHTNGNDQYAAALGFFQKIAGWELDAGWRHLQATSGSDIVLDPPDGSAPWSSISYQTNVREISESLDAGFSYTTRHNIRWAFHARKTFDGRNTDSKLWLGGSVDIPFDHLFGRGKESK